MGWPAVAPYDTSGFRSPDSVGFQYDAGDPQAYAFPGLPGTWGAVAYDFVDGGRGLTFPGLPAGISGCLDVTRTGSRRPAKAAACQGTRARP